MAAGTKVLLLFVLFLVATSVVDVVRVVLCTPVASNGIVDWLESSSINIVVADSGFVSAVEVAGEVVRACGSFLPEIVLLGVNAAATADSCADDVFDDDAAVVVESVGPCSRNDSV
jgi:hypothetical protein